MAARRASAQTKAPARKATTKKAATKKGATKKASAKREPAKKATTKKVSAKPATPAKATVNVAPVEEESSLRADLSPPSASLRTLEPAEASGSSSRSLAKAEQSGKYVYCIVQTEEELRFGAIGIGAEPSEVHTVRYGDIAAVVSDAPIEVYDPTRENVLAHERVNEIVMRRHTVIPMSFGTVFNTREDIVELLRSAYDAFHDVLQKMQNKLEFGLKVLWDPDQIITALEAEDESLRRLKQEISSQRGSTYFARMQYGRLVDQLLQERSEAFVSHIFAALRDVSVASRANKPIGERMILNAAFLVTRDQEAAFDQAVRAVGSELEQLTFRYTGPWPPYNFVNIRLKLERARDAE